MWRGQRRPWWPGGGVRLDRRLGFTGCRPRRSLGDTGKVEFDDQSVGVGDEYLEQVNLSDVSRARDESPSFQLPREAFRVIALKRDVVDDAGVVSGRARCRAKVVRCFPGNPIKAHVNLDLSANAEPITRKWEVRPRHDLESKGVAIEAARLLEVSAPHEVVIQLGKWHPVLRLSPRTTSDRAPPGIG